MSSERRVWLTRSIVGITLAAYASGFGQFGVVAALGDVAHHFGHASGGASLRDVTGLSGSDLGVGLAIIRLASLGSLAIIGWADRRGRRSTILGALALGLALTVAAAASPSYWVFVAIFACGRPLLTAVNGLAEVMAGEASAARGRTSAVAFAAAGYGVGAGTTAVLHSLFASTLGARGLFLLAVVPLAFVPLLARMITETDRFLEDERAGIVGTPVLGAIAPGWRRQLIVLSLLAAAISVITGPANSFTFLYAQDDIHLAGTATAILVVGSGITGLVGLVVGRWLADRFGRRPAGSAAVITMALCGAVMYSGSATGLVVGYLVGVLAGAALAPTIGAMLTELFPTSVRASATGWWIAAGVIGAVVGLIAFGSIADATTGFATASFVLFLPAGLSAGLFWLVPETRGTEPEALWPELPTSEMSSTPEDEPET